MNVSLTRQFRGGRCSIGHTPWGVFWSFDEDHIGYVTFHGFGRIFELTWPKG